MEVTTLIERLRSYLPLGNGSLWSQSSHDLREAADALEAKDALLAAKDAEIASYEAQLVGILTKHGEMAEAYILLKACAKEMAEALTHHQEIGLGRGRDKSHSLTQLMISGYKAGPLHRITAEAIAHYKELTGGE